MCDDEDREAMVSECAVGGGDRGGWRRRPVVHACSVFWLCVTLSKSFHRSDPLFPHLQNGNMLLVCQMAKCGAAPGG